MIARSDAACFVGIDLHKETLTACIIAAKEREVSYRKIACVARNKVREFLAGLPRPSVVAIETVGFCRWLWTEAEPLVDQIVRADARGCRALAGRRIKTDREKAAAVAIARTILLLMWTVVRKDELYKAREPIAA